MTNETLSAQNRIDWVDYAKGICIIAVVTMYSTNFVEDNMQARGWMHYVVDFAQPFRMPDFFLIAGLFGSRVVHRSLRSFIDSKVLYFVYFYAIWVTLKFINMQWHDLHGPERLRLLVDYLTLYIQPPTGQLWFIYMLPLFFISARMTQSISPGLILAGAIVIALIDVHTGIKLLDKFCMYFVFFYSGFLFAPQVFRMADWARNNVHLTLFVLAAWFAANTIVVGLEWNFFPGMQLLMGYAGAVAILLLSTVLAGIPWMQWLRYMGQHSIVIYLGFVIPLGIMRKFIVDYKLINDVGTASLTVMLVSVFGALILYWSVRSTPLRFLFVRPAWASIQTSQHFVVREDA